MKFRWYGNAANDAIRAKLGKNLHAFDDVILAEARWRIGVQGPPRSLPGDPPHMDSQRLHDSLYDEVDADALKSRIGSTEDHAVYTEVGTDTMDARPWLLPSILDVGEDAARKLVQ